MEPIDENQFGNAPENLNPLPQDNLHLNQEAIFYLHNIAKWAGFLAIVHLIVMGLLALMVIMMLFGAGYMSTFTNHYGFSGGILAFMGILYLLMIAIITLPIWWLYKFSKNTKQALFTKDAQQIAHAFHLLNRYFKFYGILTIIVLGLYALGIVGFLLIGLSTTY